ncbi:SUMF1/EgtB/PvdO family nonheme iron enzyme [Desulfococcaceae bacterium HSG9]|nr:SUMF1/EgtB/PvdO family nonheme iron enzyme [Desulfococcaceae bacterium HSG9]
MPIGTTLTTQVIKEITKYAGRKVWKRAERNDAVLRILDSVNLKPDAPNADFKSVYAHTLVEYGIEQSETVLNFFRHEDIRKAFKTSFEKNDFSILNREAENLIRWNKIGDELRDQKINPRLEFARFTFVFNTMVNRTRTPAETRRDHKLDGMNRKLDEILLINKEIDLNAIRAKNLEMIKGGLNRHLKSWFKTLGYIQGSHDICTEAYCEWGVKIPARRGYDYILVRSLEYQAEVGDVKALKKAVKLHQTDEGWLVSARRKARAAVRTADQEKNIFCYTFDELLDEQADFSRYFKWLEEFVKELAIDTDYTPLACKRDIYDEETKDKTDSEKYGVSEGWIEGYIDRWLEDPCKEHISILGEFGTGKTWFTHHYAWQMMQKYLEAKRKGLKRPRLPLVIQLRDYTKALTSESLFSDFFFRKHEIPLPGYSAFAQLNRMGKLLLIFDGFDEMADKLDRQKMINNFWELARVVTPGAKAILTCRTEHFPNAREGRDLLNAELKASTAKLTGEPPQFEILELEKFDENQIRTVLLKRADLETVDFIMGHEELIDLASRPVMLEFILDALPDIQSGKPVDLARIYLYAIRAKLDQDFAAKRTFTSLADKLFFICELSWEMLITDKMSLNYRLFPDRLQNLFGEAVAQEKDLDHWHYDMMGNNLLIRNDDGDYTPAHRSLLEFFVAVKAVAQLGMLPSDFTEPARIRNEDDIDQSSAPRNYTWNSYFRRDKDQQGGIRQIPPLKRFIPEDGDTVLDNLGRMGDAVLRFVHEITNVDDVRLRFHQLLADVLEEFRKGDRQPYAQQAIITFILKFRRLSQEWEAHVWQEDFVHRFWQKRLELEVVASGTQIKTETVILERTVGEPICLRMVKVPSGYFLMGDEINGQVHQVIITKPFLIATIPVTQALYQAVIGKNPSDIKGDEFPVENVSWFDALNFCNALSEKLNLEPAYAIEGERVEWIRRNSGFCLLTEAQWEYACRAGSTSRFAGGDLESDFESMAWFYKNSGSTTHPVKQNLPNAWGLYDMHGNVWEWVWDWYKKYPEVEVTDSSGPAEGTSRGARGGSWFDSVVRCRSAFRNRFAPDACFTYLGFRLSRPVTLGTEARPFV